MDIKTWKSDAIEIRVDYDRCTGQGECVDVCPSEVYELQDGKTVPARVEDCIECCGCVDACPEIAIIHSACD